MPAMAGMPTLFTTLGADTIGMRILYRVEER